MIVPVKIISIEGGGYHLMITARINGQKAIMLVDTGASRTVFDTNRIGRFVSAKKFSKNKELSAGLGTNTMQSHSAQIAKIVIGKKVVRRYKTVLLDLSHVNDSYEKIGFKPIDGVLGSDLMKKFKAVIDYGRKRMVLK